MPGIAIADTEYDYMRFFIKFILDKEQVKENGSVVFSRDVDLPIGIGTVSSVSGPNWPGFIRQQCGDACLTAAASMLRDHLCTEDSREIVLGTSSQLYDFIVTDGLGYRLLGGYIGAEFDYYTAPYLLKSCHSILVYKVDSRFAGSISDRVKTKERLVVAMYRIVPDGLQPLAERTVFEYDREYSVEDGYM